MKAPTQIDRYRVVRLLGQGSMGTVYLADDPKLHRQVAIKVMSEDVAVPDLRERFRREVRAVAALRHPNIVEIYDAGGDADGALYFVMEYVPGASLLQLGRAHGPLPESVALGIGHELACALEHAHAHALVHRDLKPENILLHHGRLVLTDFGIVKAVAAVNALGVPLASRTKSLGTPGFMAPEQFVGHRIDHRTDLFAAGAVLYNVVTGQVPYDGGSVAGTYRNLKRGLCVDPRRHGAALSPQSARLLAGCLAPRPGDRFASATALREALRDRLDDLGVGDVRDALYAYELLPEAAAADADAAAGNAAAQIEAGWADLQRHLPAAIAAHDAAAVRALAARLRPAAAARPRRRPPRGAQLWAAVPLWQWLAALAAGAAGEALLRWAWHGLRP